MEDINNLAGDYESGESSAPSFRTMPFSNEAEQAVLGAMIINREIIPDVIGIISSADFYIDRHSKLYGALIDLFNRGVEINYVTLKEQLEKLSLIHI